MIGENYGPLSLLPVDHLNGDQYNARRLSYLRQILLKVVRAKLTGTLEGDGVKGGKPTK